MSCFRRIRVCFGNQNVILKYGTHVMIHMSLGLLFLGGGRYTLGTSDAAIACLVTAFFPRFNQVSSDNKTFLQALRHLWVLAVEPRCLIARDVDTKEIVYLPVKIKIKDKGEVGTSQLIAPTLIPDIDKIQSIRVDTPRYWPFYLDIANMARHKESLLRNQTLFVKRRTAFLSYTEDPRGSRSLFVRSGSSAGDAAVLDFPQLKNRDQHPATDLHQFISSYSNDTFFLSFADRLCRDEGQTEQERLFLAYCHATLLDSILQDKSDAIQSHLALYRYRTMSVHSPFFGLAQQDLRFAAEFYSKLFGRWFSGRAENNPRPPLIRESTLRAALLELDEKLEKIRDDPVFFDMLKAYVRGAEIREFSRDTEPASFAIARGLGLYLQRHSVPASTLLVVLKALAYSSHARCLRAPKPDGTQNVPLLDEAIKQVVHATGMQMTSSIGSGWSLSSLDEILTAWETESQTGTKVFHE
jgi:anaphase-promoting complex subunit 1